MSNSKILLRHGNNYCEKHDVEYIEYCCSCALGLTPKNLPESTAETLRQNLLESWRATEKAMREQDMDKLHLFARVLSHDAKMLLDEQKASKEGVLKP